MTNKDRWELLSQKIESVTNAYIQATLPENLPQTFYCSYPTGRVVECSVQSVEYSHDFPTNLFGGSPTRKHISTLRENLDKGINFVPDRIIVNYQEIPNEPSDPAWKGMVKLKNLMNPNYEGNSQVMFLRRQDAEIFSQKRSEKLRAEKEFQELHRKDPKYDYTANGYKFLGWQNGWSHVFFDKDGNETTDPTQRKSFGYRTQDYPEYGNC